MGAEEKQDSLKNGLPTKPKLKYFLIAAALIFGIIVGSIGLLAMYFLVDSFEFNLRNVSLWYLVHLVGGLVYALWEYYFSPKRA